MEDLTHWVAQAFNTTAPAAEEKITTSDEFSIRKRNVFAGLSPAEVDHCRRHAAMRRLYRKAST